MKKLLMVIAGATILTLAACGGKAPEKAPETPPATGTQTPAPGTEGEAPEGEATSYDAAAAEESYKTKTCINCHGQNLEGQGSFPSLKGTGLSADEIYNVIENGRGTMPPKLVEGDEAKNLAAWIAAQ